MNALVLNGDNHGSITLRAATAEEKAKTSARLAGSALTVAVLEIRYDPPEGIRTLSFNYLDRNALLAIGAACCDLAPAPPPPPTPTIAPRPPWWRFW